VVVVLACELLVVLFAEIVLFTYVAGVTGVAVAGVVVAGVAGGVAGVVVAGVAGVVGVRGASVGVVVVVLFGVVVFPPCSNLFTVLRGGSRQSHFSQTIVEHWASLSQADPIESCSEHRCEGRHCEADRYPFKSPQHEQELLSSPSCYAHSINFGAQIILSLFKRG